MEFEARGVPVGIVRPLRELFRAEAQCQIIRDSFAERGFCDHFTLHVDDRLAGYGSVANRYYEGRIIEFYVFPDLRARAKQLFRALACSGMAVEVEAQTNMCLMLLMLNDFAADIKVENILFSDQIHTDLPPPSGATMRHFADRDEAHVFEHKVEPRGDWVVEFGGQIVGTGGTLTHYNPPFGDIYMEVDEPFRGQGFGSWLVQELKRQAYEQGCKPAARCSPENSASRRTCERAGLLPCGQMLSGQLSGLEPGDQ